MNQQPSIRDLLANHLGASKPPISVDLSGNHTEDPGQPPALNSPELKTSIMNAIAGTTEQDGK
ncbi:hypothetical protein [Glutamicibacter arilaitensis]|uniref:hypothetical protein n=1 Tax=Glutamicibacter arilaitensis TaxID=256701 RepID=UPI003F8E9358